MVMVVSLNSVLQNNGVEDKVKSWTYPVSPAAGGGLGRGVVAARVARQLVRQRLEALRALAVDHPHLRRLLLVEALQLGLALALARRRHEPPTCG